MYNPSIHTKLTLDHQRAKQINNKNSNRERQKSKTKNSNNDDKQNIKYLHQKPAEERNANGEQRKCKNRIGGRIDRCGKRHGVGEQRLEEY